MSCYEALAVYYDRLTADVDYQAFADRYEQVFRADGGEFRLLLDLYGTVDAAFCSLEGINYLSPEQLNALFHRLYLFIRPGGLFLFDIRSPEYLAGLDGDTFVDEDDNVFCLWRADFDPEMDALVYGMDLFSREGRLWRRSREEHIEYAHSVSGLSELLGKHGFSDFSSLEAEDRVFVRCRRGK